MTLKNRRLLNAVQYLKGRTTSVIFIVLMGGSAFFISPWVVPITIFDQHFYEATSRSISGRENLSNMETSFPKFQDVRREGKNLDYTKVSRAPESENHIPTTILAAGDIAKCDGEDNWREKFLQLVGILPDKGPKEPFSRKFSRVPLST